MARYRDLADILRMRIQSGEFPVGTQLPDIRELQVEYRVPVAATIRAAQQVLIEEGILTSGYGTGAVVTSTEPVTAGDLLDALTHTRDNLTTIITTLKRQKPTTPSIPFRRDSNAYAESATRQIPVSVTRRTHTPTTATGFTPYRFTTNKSANTQ